MPTKRTMKAPARSTKRTGAVGATGQRGRARTTPTTRKVARTTTKTTTGRAAKAARPKGEMTVREAGRRGGERVKATRGSAFYAEIGRKGGAKGGPKVRELIERGKQATGEYGYKQERK